jgi:TonB family protein
MKLVSISRIKSLFIITLLSFSLLLFGQTGYAQSTAPPQQQQAVKLSLSDIIAALRSKKVSLAERNKLISEGVKTRGITFALNTELEKELRAAGAFNELVDAIRQKSPVIKTAAVSTPPKNEPKPVPVETPRPTEDFAFYHNRANASFVLGEYDSAIADYSKAIELNSKVSTIFFSRAFAYFNKKNYARAISDFDKAIELDPKESMSYFKRGSALEKNGNLERALSDYQKAIELETGNELAKEAFERLQSQIPKPAPAPPPTIVQNVSETKKDVTMPADMQKIADDKKVAPSKEKTKTSSSLQNVGAFNSQAIKLVTPIYPLFEKQRRTEGLVTVEVVVDEEGKVVSAKAASGPPALRAVSEDAARRSKFKPVMIDNKPIRASGFINYNFKLN